MLATDFVQPLKKMEMKKNQQFSWDDYLFENSNKAYGAYALRTGESDNLLKSLLIGLLLVGIMVVFFSFANKNNEIAIEKDNPPLTEHILENIKDRKPPLPEKPAMSKAIPVSVTKGKMENKTTPNPTESPDVETPPAIHRDLGKITMPDVGNTSGDTGMKTPAVVGSTEGSSEGDFPLAAPDPERVFSPREISAMAVFPGCEKAGTTKKALQDCMSAKLQEELIVQLNGFGRVAANRNIQTAHAKLIFIVDKSGKITGVHALRGGNEEFSKEAQEALKRISERLVKRGSLIRPAQLSDGTSVNMNFTIPLKYQFQN